LRRRCSASAACRLFLRSCSCSARRVQRSTPPAASRRDTAATRWGHVSQNVVGNGSLRSSYGLCSVTAGRPNGQRTATRRNARGSRPIWRATTARSSSASTVGHHAGPLALAPLLDPADDEEVLAGADVAERARLAPERRERR